MAQLNKTDDFFKSKLDAIEFAPQADAWAQVQNQLGKKALPLHLIITRVAAAIVILIAATLIFFNIDSKDNSELIGFIDHPTLVGNNQVEVSRIIVPQLTVEMVPSTENHKKNRAHLNQENNEPIKVNSELPMLQIERIATIDIVVEATTEIPLIKLNNTKQAIEKVKITYIASTEIPESVDTDGKLNRMMAVAQNVSPSNLLAELRAAKNNLFQTNLLIRN